MADNILLNAGTGGQTLATDQTAGGQHFQQVKLTDGTADSTTAIAAGGGVEAAALRVTIASDSTGVVSVDDNGGSLTVDGTVTEANSAAILADTAAMDTNLATVAGAVAGTEMQVDVVTSALPTGAATAAKQPALGTAGASSVDVISVQGIASGTAMAISGTVTANVGTGTQAISAASLPLPTGASTETTAAAIAASVASIDTNLGGTSAVDTAAGGTDSGAVMLAIRDDALTTLTPVDGDYTNLRVSSTGALHVTGGGGGTEYTEDVATADPIVGSATLMERDDALTTVTPVEGDWIGLRGSAEGALWTQDFNSDAILADTTTIAGDTTSIDGKITACNTGAVVISSGAVTSTLAAETTKVIGTVNVAAGQTIAATNAGTFATQATLQAGSASIGTLGANSGVDIGDVDVTSISAGANLIGDVGISGARTSGGCTPIQLLDVDETEDAVKASAGQVYFIHAINMAATTNYLKFYNLTVANTTVGTSTPVLTFPVPPNSTTGGGFVLNVPNGIAFDTAITVAATTAAAVADTGAPGAGEVIVNIGYA